MQCPSLLDCALLAGASFHRPAMDLEKAPSASALLGTSLCLPACSDIFERAYIPAIPCPPRCPRTCTPGGVCLLSHRHTTRALLLFFFPPPSYSSQETTSQTTICPLCQVDATAVAPKKKFLAARAEAAASEAPPTAIKTEGGGAGGGSSSAQPIENAEASYSVKEMAPSGVVEADGEEILKFQNAQLHAAHAASKQENIRLKEEVRRRKLHAPTLIRPGPTISPHISFPGCNSPHRAAGHSLPSGPHASQMMPS